MKLRNSLIGIVAVTALFTVTTTNAQASSWSRDTPSAIRGTWKNNTTECIFYHSQANSRYINQTAAWSGGFWNPEYKYVGHDTYKVRSGYQKGYGYSVHYTIHKYSKNYAKINDFGTLKRVSESILAEQ